MADCISCSIKVKSEEIDGGDRLIVNCKNCGTYDISRPAISRVKRNRSEMRRFVTELRKARASSKILVVAVVPGTGLKFETGDEAL